MSLVFSVEPYEDCAPEMIPYYAAHHAEVAVNHYGFKVEIDFEKYISLARDGKIHVVTARDAGRLVGYQQFILTTFLHYKSVKVAYSDLTYLAPEYRKGTAGYRLIKFALLSLKDLSLGAVIMNCKLWKDYGPLVNRLGFVADEHSYIKVM